MARRALTGTRIRERRTLLGIKQAELARDLEISPSYLNLIEHNRRRIAGKLLTDVARVLRVEVSALTQGAEAELLDQLTQAASAAGPDGAETDKIDELVGRYPGWSKLIRDQYQRIAELEGRIEELSDRLTHDPRLSSAMHELLSKATAIKSVSSILVETEDIDEAWRGRFHRNLHGDSMALAESAQDLLGFFDADGAGTDQLESPWAEVESLFQAHDFHFPALETQGEAAVDGVLADGPAMTPAAQGLARVQLRQYARDAVMVPLDLLREHMEQQVVDPAAIAHAAGVSLQVAVRRLISAPAMPGRDPIGAVVADGTGGLLMRKSTAGFLVPRSGRACPIWPLFEAIAAPGRPVHRTLQHSAAMGTRVSAHAVAEQNWPLGSEGPGLVTSWMILQPIPDRADSHGTAPVAVGSACRVCVQDACVARQEPSVLASGFDTPV